MRQASLETSKWTLLPGSKRLKWVSKIVQEGGINDMGQRHQFRAGEKAPNNGIYVEIGETGSMVVNPKKVRLKAGDRFPETSNDDRHWTYKRKP
ncbi:MAG TPA: YjzC family protein [Chondromyces sp.]|nr:YjzC family protein [Chondromyces sp.]